MKDLSLGVRCISIEDRLGFETPSAMMVLSSKNVVLRTLESLGKKKDRLIRERAELAKDPKTSPAYLARYDDAIANIRETLARSAAAGIRVR